MSNRPTNRIQLPESFVRIIEARHHDPFEVLGRHVEDGRCSVRVFLPRAARVWIVEADVELTRIEGTDLFVWEGTPDQVPRHYRLTWEDAAGEAREHYDPYCLGPRLQDLDLHLFGEGRHLYAYRFLGAHGRTLHQAEGYGIDGTGFAVWAPNARRVSVVGDFNGWDGRAHPMRAHRGCGVWELFIPGLRPGELYKFEILDCNGNIQVKIDPYARSFQVRPDTAAVICDENDYPWLDQDWMQARNSAHWQHTPMSIYEVHLGSWQRDAEGGFLDYRTLARQLADYARELGFTHIELLPVSEHPLDASWGYQTTGYYAPTSRFGSPEDFRWFVDHLHQNGIGVILDWVPAHFARDAFALAHYDGSALYEHADPRLGEHKDWGTLIFNYARNEVANFLISNAVYWLEEFHIDGLRVDAVASMLYLDYSRNHGEWIPNEHGGNENLQAIEFLRRLNVVTHERYPGTLMIAEESTAWPAVSRPTDSGGLGFTMKWNMGWMHDTLDYMSKDPVYRHFHHDQLTCGLLWAFSENFVLPFSHDEVVHGKGSILDRMPGDEWRKLASLRLLYTLMFTYPGKKLLFMGCELGQGREWDFDGQLDWDLLEHPRLQGIARLVTDLNRLYRSRPALHDLDFSNDGFEWIDCHDSSQSMISFIRKDRTGNQLLAVFNLVPLPRIDYRLGVPLPGVYREILNSDARIYGGGQEDHPDDQTDATSEPIRWMGHPQSIRVRVPPSGAILLVPESDRPRQKQGEREEGCG